MRVLVVGDGHSELHEQVVSNAFIALGHIVEEFKWHRYFEALPGTGQPLIRLVRRFQQKYIIGATVNRINCDLISTATRFRPDVIFIYRGTHITRKTLSALRASLPQCVLVGYNNDDPFSPHQPRYLWRYFIAAIPFYDLVLAYRHINLEEYRSAGARRVELLRSWYVAERNHPVTLSETDQNLFATDVVFVGHYESDQRLSYLEEVVHQGFTLRIFGPGRDWDPVIRQSPLLRSKIPIQLVWGGDYNRALCGAKIALCFFSKLNRDTYTRRCFEIPASGTLLLCEHSDDLASLYRLGEEAESFSSCEEMIAKIRYYLSNSERRQSVATAGHGRVVSDHHDVISRMAQVVKWATAIKSQALA